MGAKTTIRRPTAAEIGELPALEVESYLSYADIGMSEVAVGNEPDVGFLSDAFYADNIRIALCDTDIAGFIEYRTLDETLYIAGVNVRPRFLGHRIGALLLEAAAELATARGLHRLSLTTFQDVPWNAPYYERLGWRTLAEEETSAGLLAIRARQRDAGYERWPRTTMVKDLSS
ncbi:GNAT family N-acetyltransferase [Flexivirga endophytica]|nr:GNAT family N-acetyltransferase [Flexivirga endophytica]